MSNKLFGILGIRRSRCYYFASGVNMFYVQETRQDSGHELKHCCLLGELFTLKSAWWQIVGSRPKLIDVAEPEVRCMLGMLHS